MTLGQRWAETSLMRSHRTWDWLLAKASNPWDFAAHPFSALAMVFFEAMTMAPAVMELVSFALVLLAAGQVQFEAAPL